MSYLFFFTYSLVFYWSLFYSCLLVLSCPLLCSCTLLLFLVYSYSLLCPFFFITPALCASLSLLYSCSLFYCFPSTIILLLYICISLCSDLAFSTAVNLDSSLAQCSTLLFLWICALPLFPALHFLLYSYSLLFSVLLHSKMALTSYSSISALKLVLAVAFLSFCILKHLWFLLF